ncbi:MAG: hypothetical protein NTY90_05515 [Candidatus Micrarchaeota archaeon]|nr:hypothetical protein [Candidatus Micrarchaeota archaeon]
MEAAGKGILGRISGGKEPRTLEHIEHLLIEPTFGCKMQCRQCGSAPIPEHQAFLEVKTLRKTLDKLQARGLSLSAPSFPSWPSSVIYGLHGEPLANPGLHKITRELRERFPRAKAVAFWGLGGVPSAEKLAERTKGLDLLLLSVDGQHWGGKYLEMKRNGKLPETKKTEAVDGEIRKLIKWAWSAAAENNFRVEFNVVGGERQKRQMLPLIESASPGRNAVVHTLEREPRGSGKGHPPLPGHANIYHDGTHAASPSPGAYLVRTG